MWEEEELDEWEERRIREAMLDKVVGRTGRFQVDAMAHEDGRNSVAGRWYSKRNQPFEEEWKGEKVWWAPPRHMCRRVARFLRSKVREGTAGKPALLIPAAVWAQERGSWVGWELVWSFPRGTKLWRPVRECPPPKEDEAVCKETWVVVMPTKA